MNGDGWYWTGGLELAVAWTFQFWIITRLVGFLWKTRKEAGE